jgi:putative heme iron utilization protein
MAEQLEAITASVSDRICKHMNDDHADAVLLYAQVYGNLPEATAATMLAIDSQGMDLKAQTPSSVESVRVTFDHDLASAQDAHHTLVAMLKQVRSPET